MNIFRKPWIVFDMLSKENIKNLKNHETKNLGAFNQMLKVALNVDLTGNYLDNLFDSFLDQHK